MTDASPSPAPVRPFAVPLVPDHGLRGSLLALAAPPDLTTLAERTGLLMISIKNPHFTRVLIEKFCVFATRHLRQGYVSVVDQPYVQNILATPDDGAHATRIEGLRRLAADRTRQVGRILRRHGGDHIRFVPWGQLTSRTPEWLAAEVWAAWLRRGALYEDLIAQARHRVGWDTDRVALERWALFLVEETPALLYSYYMLDGAVVDVYPGPLPGYIWRLERGDYATELPRASALIASRQGLVYAQVRP